MGGVVNRDLIITSNFTIIIKFLSEKPEQNPIYSKPH